MPKDAPGPETTSVSAGTPEPDSGGELNAQFYRSMFLRCVDVFDGHTGVSMMAQMGLNWAAGTFIRVNRAKSRKYMLTGLSVNCGHRFTHYEITACGGVKAFFEDGSTATGDILVGADGLRSRGKEHHPRPALMLITAAYVKCAIPCINQIRLH